MKHTLGSALLLATWLIISPYTAHADSIRHIGLGVINGSFNAQGINGSQKVDESGFVIVIMRSWDNFTLRNNIEIFDLHTVFTLGALYPFVKQDGLRIGAGAAFYLDDYSQNSTQVFDYKGLEANLNAYYSPPGNARFIEANIGTRLTGKDNLSSYITYQLSLGLSF